MVARRLCASFCVLLVTASCFVSYEPAPPAGATAVGPSVLLITVDTLRADHLGAYGLGVGASPQIDRLEAAWLRGANSQRALAPSATRYAWDGRHPWTALGDQAVFAPEIDRYLRSAARMQPADVPGNQEIARLRALGYLEGS